MKEYRLRDWRARRAGGAITVTGNDAESGEPVRIANVVQITAGPRPARIFSKPVSSYVVARMADNITEHKLLLD